MTVTRFIPRLFALPPHGNGKSAYHAIADFASRFSHVAGD